MVNTSEERSLDGKRIGILGKGGSGKSTVTVLLAMAFRDQGYHVCVLDADSTNIGLSQALGFEHSPETLLDYFGGMVFSGGSITCPVDDPTPLPDAVIHINKMPSDFFIQQAGITLLSAGKIGQLGPGAGCDGPVAKIARDLKINLGKEPAVTLVDFKAGFEDTARGAVTSLDWAIVIVDPTIAAIEMAGDMDNMVTRMKSFELPATMHLESPELVDLANSIFLKARIKGVLTILNKMSSSDMENRLRKALREKGLTPIGVIREQPSFTISWLNGETLALDTVGPVLQEVVKRLEVEEAAYEAQLTGI